MLALRRGNPHACSRRNERHTFIRFSASGCTTRAFVVQSEQMCGRHSTGRCRENGLHVKILDMCEVLAGNPLPGKMLTVDASIVAIARCEATGLQSINLWC